MSLLFTGFFALIPLFIVGVFVIVVGGLIVGIFRNLLEWQSNNALPVLSLPVRVVTKRQHVSGGGNETAASTSYYATFESIEDARRQEFAISAKEFSGMAEGDTGVLSHQGTRYKGFERDRTPRPVAPVPTPTPAPPPVDAGWQCAYCHGRVRADLTKCPSCGAAERVPEASLR